MKLVILLWILPVTLGDASVTCIYSEECILPCTSTNLNPSSSAKLIIHWYKEKSPVHSFYHDADQLGHQSAEYTGRTSLFSKPEIYHGNVSLLLKNIRVDDEGKYKCYTADDKTNDEKFVSVSVEAPVKSVDLTLKDDTLTCTTSGVYPEPTVLWSSSPRSKEQPKTEKTQTEERLLTVTSVLKVDATGDHYKYNCTITSEDGTKTRYSILEKQVISEPEKEKFTFNCPVTKDLNYTLVLTFSTAVLRFDSKTKEQNIDEEWRDKVHFNPEDGIVTLSDISNEQSGTYTCESTTSQYRYSTQATVPSRGLSTVVSICIGLVVTIFVGLIIFLVVKRKRDIQKCCKIQPKETNTNGRHETDYNRANTQECENETELIQTSPN